jgi:hypothetical protein
VGRIYCRYVHLKEYCFLKVPLIAALIRVMFFCVIWANSSQHYIAPDPEKNPLDVPIVQVSLFLNEDSDQHYRMGQALAGLRDEGVLIIGAGMAVHNLRDFRATRGTGATLP